jgi:hypothetical protein
MPKQKSKRYFLSCIGCGEKLTKNNTTWLWQRRCYSCAEAVKNRKPHGMRGRPRKASAL